MLPAVLGFIGKLFCSVQSFVLTVLRIEKKKANESTDTDMPVPGILCHEITKNITLLTYEKNFNITACSLGRQQEKPLLVLMCWLNSEKKHSNKFAKYWIEKGFDVLTVRIRSWQFLLPVPGAHVVAADVIKVLDKNKSFYSHIVLHGLSVGGYLWAEALVQMVKNLDQYQPILDKIVGQIWDSVAGLDEVPDGLPIALFPDNKFLASVLHHYLVFHLKIFNYYVTRHYKRTGEVYYTDIVPAPALIILSKTDPIGNVKTNTGLKNCWENVGMKVHWKCFESSPHVGHYREHPEEYIAQLNMFLDSLNLPPSIAAQKQKYLVLNKL